MGVKSIASRIGWPAVAVLVAASAAPAAAQQTWSVLGTYGIRGTWSASCADPPGASNWFITFSVDAAGVVSRVGHRGPDLEPLATKVDGARRESASSLRMRVRNDDPNWGTNDGIAVDVHVEVVDGRMRTISSTTPDGRAFIQDRKFLSSGAPVPWLSKCRD